MPKSLATWFMDGPDEQNMINYSKVYSRRIKRWMEPQNFRKFRGNANLNYEKQGNYLNKGVLTSFYLVSYFVITGNTQDVILWIGFEHQKNS